MELDKVKINISKVKFPVLFLLRLITFKNEIGDNDLSIILRIFLNYHTETALIINLKELFQDELYDYNMSWEVLDNFYQCMDKKIKLIMVLQKWHRLYNNKKFWKLNLTQQIQFLYNTKHVFRSVFDCAKGGTPFYFKLINMFNDTKTEKNELKNNIIERLSVILKMFGPKVFMSLGIPLITVTEFYDLSNEHIFKYLVTVYKEFNSLLDQTIGLFETYKLVVDQLNSLLNPVTININTVKMELDIGSFIELLDD